MRRLTALIALVLVAASLGVRAAAETPVLDLDRGSLRGFIAWKTPALLTDEGTLKPLAERKGRGGRVREGEPVPVVASAGPQDGWTTTSFDDSRWPRVRGAVVVRPWFGGNIFTPGNPAEYRLACVRGKFRVTDPAQVEGLRLEASYHGGIVVYVNGAELMRRHLPAGSLPPDALAEPYPAEAYLRPDGQLYGEGDEKALAERMECRVRRVADEDAGGVPIPASLLRPGVNVIAVEVRAAPVRDLVVAAPETPPSWRGSPTPWPHVGLLSLRVVADSDAGLVANTAAGPVIELGNCQPLETVTAWDFADPADAPRPVRIVGARNGTFSGKVVLSSAATIRNLRAVASDLAAEQSGGRIPAAAVELRWAEPSDPRYGRNHPERFERLLAEFPNQIEPRAVAAGRGEPTPPAAAVVPVWITVHVSRDAAPGRYRGTLRIEAEGTEPARFEVPVELGVSDWALPDPDDFVTHHDIYQSPESVARYYDVPLWSDRHFELMGRSLRVLHEVAGKVCVLNLAVQSANMGNSQSMVRWLRQPDGTYKHDFSIVDRYLDLYEQAAGKPAILCLNVWGHYRKEDKQHRPPLAVSVLDPATGRIEAVEQPPYGTPDNVAFWKPVLDQLRDRLEKRGWFDVTAVCYASYCWAPPKEMADVYRAIWPDGKWMNASHSNPSAYESMPCPYSEWIWGCGALYNPDADGAEGYPAAWRRGQERIEMGNPRVGVGFVSVLREHSPLASFRSLSEATMQGGLRGIGRVGGDFWPLPSERPGEYAPLCDALFAIGPVNSVTAMTSPGPDGAIYNGRLEMFREGVQVAEAIALVQRALASPTIGAGLAERISRHLDERARYYLRTRPGQPASWWSLECSPWQQRDAELFDLAAEAARMAVADGDRR